MGKRTLTGDGYGSGNAMTNSACVQYCASKGFYYAGTEYAAECCECLGSSVQDTFLIQFRALQTAAILSRMAVRSPQISQLVTWHAMVRYLP